MHTIVRIRVYEITRMCILKQLQQATTLCQLNSIDHLISVHQLLNKHILEKFQDFAEQ
jgi:hypothetical protein